MADEKEIIINVDINADKAVADLAESQKLVKDLKAEIVKLSKSEDDNSLAIAKKTGELKNAQVSLREQTRLVQDNINLENKEVVTLDTLNAANSALRKERKSLNLNTAEGRDRVAEINEEIDKNNALISENADKNKQNKLNVGGYTESIKAAIGGTGKFNLSLKALAANPIGLIVTAIVATLVALFNAFKSTQKGADQLDKASAVLAGTMEALQGILGEFATKLVDAFSDPKQALLDYIDLLKTNLIGRFEGLLKLIPRLSEALILLFKGEFKESAKTAGDAIAQVVTGVEDFSDKAGAFFDDVAEKAEVAAKNALILKNAQIALEQSLANSTKQLAKLNAEAEIQDQIANDSTKTFEERQKAADLAAKASEDALKIEIDRAKQELNIINLQAQIKRNAGKETRELALQQAEAVAKVTQANNALTLAELNNAKLKEEINRDLFEKNLDYLLDNFDNIKTINESIAADETKSYQFRLDLIKKTKALSDQSFNEQIKELQTRTDVTINANDLINESDSRRLIEKVRLLKLDEIEETRLLEVIRDRRTAVKDLADAEIEIEKSKGQELKAFRDNQRTLELEAQKQSIFSELELQRVKLQAKEEAELEHARKVGAETTAIEQRYANARKEINKAEQDAKISLASDFVGNIATIAGEGTAIGKAAAVAQTAISTYQGATSAYAALAPIPIVGPGLGAVASAAAIASGLANVRKILAVDSGLPGSSSAGGASTPSAPQAPSVNQGIVSRDAEQSQTSDINVQPTLVVDSVTNAQNLNSENKNTSTI